MGRERRSKAWWQETTGRWRRSGLTSDEFAELEGVRASTLRWWSSQFKHGTRAVHGSSAIVPIEIAVPERRGRGISGTIEITVGDAVVRCDGEVDATYLASVVRALRKS